MAPRGRRVDESPDRPPRPRAHPSALSRAAPAVGVLLCCLGHRLAEATVSVGCCQNLTGEFHSPYVSDTYGRPITGSAMVFGNRSVCALSRRLELVSANANGCSGQVTWDEAKEFCEGADARLCTIEELQQDDTHGSGCNYDYQQIWSSTLCESCAREVTSYQTTWGYSRVAINNGMPTAPECREATQLAYTRCCADSCPGADPDAEYDRLVAVSAGTLATVDGNCAGLNDALGTFPPTLAGQPYTHPCPGTNPSLSLDFGTFSRQCLGNGSWAGIDTVDLSGCSAPTACAVCDCFECGNPGQRVCGAVVGIQEASQSGFAVDCAHRKLVVAPRDYPTQTTRIDLQGNTLMQAIPDDAFASALHVRQIYTVGTPLTTIPSGVFNLTTIEVYDDNNLDSLPHHGFHRWTALRIFAVYLGRLTQFPPEPFRVCNRLTYVEISSSPLLQLTTDLFVGATALESVLLIGNSIMPEIPAGLFTPVAHSLQTLAIRYNHQLHTLPVQMLARPASSHPSALLIDITENSDLTRVGPHTFTEVGRIPSLKLGSTSALLTLDDHAFASVGNVSSLSLIGVDLAAANADTFSGLQLVQRLRLLGVSRVSVVAVPMRDVDPFRNFEAVVELEMDGVNVQSLSHGLFARLSRLEELDLRCLPVARLGIDLFSEHNAALREIRVSSCPDLELIEPYIFQGIPRLGSIDLSNNPRLTELLPMTFDGAFQSTDVARPRVLLGSSYLEVISKRAFNFDIFGISGTAAITVETAEGSAGLRTCCGYEWLTTDRHFAVAGLSCVNVDNISVRVGSSAATPHCCINASDAAAVAQLRTAANRPSSASYLSLTPAEQGHLGQFCDNAGWEVSETSRLVRGCGAGCEEDTAASPSLRRALQPGEDTCDGAGTTCPDGYRIELGGPIQLLDCEPWFHASPPRYETSHFVGELACEPCGVINCSRCDLGPRQCTECRGASTLHSNTSGFFCLDSCPPGYARGGANPDGVPTCVAVARAESGLAGSLIATLCFAAFIVAVAIAIVVWATRKRTVASRRRRRLLHYIKALLAEDPAGAEGLDGGLGVTPDGPTCGPLPVIAAQVSPRLEAARRDVMSDVLYYSPHLAEAQDVALRRASFVELGLPPVRSDSNASEYDDHGWINELNGALFLSLELNQHGLIPGLIAAGADGTLKHPDSGKLAVSQLLSGPDEVPMVEYPVVKALFSAHRLDIDDAMGQMLRRRRQFIRLIGADGAPFALPPRDPSRSRTYSRSQTFRPSASRRESFSELDYGDAGRSGAGGLGAGSRGETVNGSQHETASMAHLSKYSHRESEGYYKVNVVVQHVVSEMAEADWRSPDDSKDTVIHRILTACQLGRLSESVALELVDAVLDRKPGLLTAENGKGVSPQKIALNCHGYPRIEQIFTIVVFKRYQLITPGRPRYKSDTAVVHEVRDLRKDTDSEPTRLAIKLMRDEPSWVRELQLRSLSYGATADVVAVKVAATLAPSINFQSRVPVDCYPGLVESVRLTQTADLLREFPFALIMPMADRNLAEVVQNERLAEEQLDVIRQVGYRIGTAIHGLHQAGIVHGDIKPRNIIREGANYWRLIDLDMSFAWHRGGAPGQQSSFSVRSGDSDLFEMISIDGPRLNLASPDKVWGSSAYQCPELLAYAQAAQSNDALLAVDELLSTAFRIDFWSFGATLYEIATGLPLFEHQYDRITMRGEEMLKNWDGLTSVHVKAVEALHGLKESAALIDLLNWLLDPIPSHRPADMAGVMAHLFFNPLHGRMREHAAVEHIRALLEDRSTGPRKYRKVMISYCWDESSFVLNRLAPELATVVEGLWLDRLGGEHGMGEWTMKSMERGISGCDVVVAVVSPSYCRSESCGLEMALVHKYRKDMIPLMLGVPEQDWPPTKIGDVQMADQFRDPDTGDMRLYINFTDVETSSHKINSELLPRLLKTAHANWSAALHDALAVVAFEEGAVHGPHNGGEGASLPRPLPLKELGGMGAGWVQVSRASSNETNDSTAVFVGTPRSPSLEELDSVPPAGDAAAEGPSQGEEHGHSEGEGQSEGEGHSEGEEVVLGVEIDLGPRVPRRDLEILPFVSDQPVDEEV